jgi:hypothetical protein
LKIEKEGFAMNTLKEDREREIKHLKEVAIPQEKERLKKGDTSLSQFSVGGSFDVPLSLSENLAQLEARLAGIDAELQTPA